MTIYYQGIARQVVDLIDRLVENNDPKTEATRAVANLFSEIIESAESRPIWLWRELIHFKFKSRKDDPLDGKRKRPS